MQWRDIESIFMSYFFTLLTESHHKRQIFFRHQCTELKIFSYIIVSLFLLIIFFLLHNHFQLPVRMWSEVVQLCPTLCDPMDCSPPGSSVLGYFQARILEWVAMLSSSGSSWPRDQTQVSCIADRRFTLWATRDTLWITSGDYARHGDCS